MSEDRGSVGTKYEEEEEERGGGLRKRRRSEEEEEEDEEGEGDTSVRRSELPPGRRECQQLKEHTTCLANRTNRNGCFLRQLMTDRLKRWIIPQAKEEAEESYPDMDPELALEEILDETLPEIHKRFAERTARINLFFGKMSSLHLADEHCRAFTSYLAFICTFSHH